MEKHKVELLTFKSLYKFKCFEGTHTLNLKFEYAYLIILHTKK